MTAKPFILKCTLVLILSCRALNVFAQQGEIAGTVADEKNQPLVGAIVRVSSTSITKGGSATDVDGRYVVTPLAAGNNYEVKVDYTGYETAVFKDIVVRDGGSTNVNINLKRNNIQLREEPISYRHGPCGVRDYPHGVLDAKDIKRIGITNTADLIAIASPGIHTAAPRINDNASARAVKVENKEIALFIKKVSTYANPYGIAKADIDHIR